MFPVWINPKTHEWTNLQSGSTTQLCKCAKDFYSCKCVCFRKIEYKVAELDPEGKKKSQTCNTPVTGICLVFNWNQGWRSCPKSVKGFIDRPQQGPRSNINFSITKSIHYNTFNWNGKQWTTQQIISMNTYIVLFSSKLRPSIDSYLKYKETSVNPKVINIVLCDFSS